MNSEGLRATQAPIKELYKARPDAALITLKAEGRLGEGITCSVQTGKALVEAGLHPATGGTGLSACLGKPERRNDIMRVTAAIVPPARAEAGCISYAIHERLSGEDDYLFFAEWTDQAALDFHFKTPHFQEFIREFTQLLQAPPHIRIYEVAEARTLEL